MNCVFKINGTAPRTKSALLTGICLAKKLEWTLVTSEERWEIVSRVSEEESSIEAIVVRLRPSIRRGLKFYYTTFRKTRFDRDIVSMHLPFQKRFPPSAGARPCSKMDLNTGYVETRGPFPTCRVLLVVRKGNGVGRSHARRNEAVKTGKGVETGGKLRGRKRDCEHREQRSRWAYT